MSISIIQEIKINLVNYLVRWKKQIAAALAILAFLLLLTVIQRSTLNNSAWLQGGCREIGGISQLTIHSKQKTKALLIGVSSVKVLWP